MTIVKATRTFERAEILRVSQELEDKLTEDYRFYDANGGSATDDELCKYELYPRDVRGDKVHGRFDASRTREEHPEK